MKLQTNDKRRGCLKFAYQIRYKAEEYSIKVTLREESYTCAMDMDVIADFDPKETEPKPVFSESESSVESTDRKTGSWSMPTSMVQPISVEKDSGMSG